MKSSIKILEIIVIISLILLMIYKIFTFKEPFFNKIELTKTNTVINKTKITYLDTIINVGLNELGCENIVVVLKPLTLKTITDNSSEIKLHAYIIGSGNQYIIYIDIDNRKDAINILSHELIHLKQYKDKELIIVDNVYYWYNNIIKHENISYFDRPWEVDAETKKTLLINKINKVLYSKSFN